MANLLSNIGLKLAVDALLASGVDVRCILLRSGTNAGTTWQDADTIADVDSGSLVEFDGSGYSSGGIALTGETVAADDTANDASGTADSVAFGALGSGTTNITHVGLIKWGGTLNTSVPLFLFDTVTGFPLDPAGATVTINWAADGIAEATSV